VLPGRRQASRRSTIASRLFRSPIIGRRSACGRWATSGGPAHHCRASADFAIVHVICHTGASIANESSPIKKGEAPSVRSSQGSATCWAHVPILERRLANQNVPNRLVASRRSESRKVWVRDRIAVTDHSCDRRSASTTGAPRLLAGVPTPSGPPRSGSPRPSVPCRATHGSSSEGPRAPWRWLHPRRLGRDPKLVVVALPKARGGRHGDEHRPFAHASQLPEDIAGRPPT
jgi:hypothetical protein